MPDLTTRPEEKKKQLPEKCQLELIGSESADRREKKTCPWDAIKMPAFDEGVEHVNYFYQPKALDAATGVYVTNALDKRRFEEKQLELYETDP